MSNNKLFKYWLVAVAVGLTACSSSNDSDPAANTSAFNPDLAGPEDTGEPGGDTTAIAGLWDGTTVANGATDIVYWNLAANGVLTRYDYQQDGAATASGENCYTLGAPISVSPENSNDYSFFNVAITAVRNGDSLLVTFIEPDKNDVDEDGDTAESPNYNWTLLTTPVLSDLNSCTLTTEASSAVILDDESIPVTDETNPTEPDTTEVSYYSYFTEGLAWPDVLDYSGPGKPDVTDAVCTANGGTVVSDIGDGTMFRPEYRCTTGRPPIAYLTYVEGDLIYAEGAVCCV